MEKLREKVGITNEIVKEIYPHGKLICGIKVIYLWIKYEELWMKI